MFRSKLTPGKAGEGGDGALQTTHKYVCSAAPASRHALRIHSDITRKFHCREQFLESCSQAGRRNRQNLAPLRPILANLGPMLIKLMAELDRFRRTFADIGPTRAQVGEPLARFGQSWPADMWQLLPLLPILAEFGPDSVEFRPRSDDASRNGVMLAGLFRQKSYTRKFAYIWTVTYTHT